jgi:hypothetical protein
MGMQLVIDVSEFPTFVSILILIQTHNRPVVIVSFIGWGNQIVSFAWQIMEDLVAILAVILSLHVDEVWTSWTH